MKVCRLEPSDAAWARALEGAAHDFYHLPAYVGLCAEQDGARACAMLVEDGPRWLLQPLLERALPDDADVDGFDATSPYGYPGPIVAGDPDFAADAARALEAELRSAGCVSCFVRLHPLLNEGFADAGPPGVLENHGETVVVDLAQDAETHWKQTRSGHRNEINRALKKGHVARIATEEEAFSRFAEIYRATMRRIDASAYYLFDDTYFAALRNALGARLNLCVIEIDGEVAAGGLFTESSGVVQYHLSGTDERFIRERPNKLMLHFVRGWARERANRWVHLGGGVGGTEDNLFRFKSGFSKGRRPFHTWRLIVRPDAYERLASGRHGSGARLDGLGYFPDYRRPAS